MRNLLLACLAFLPFHHATSQSTLPDLGMPREKILYNDNQLRLFSGSGAAYVRRYSLTGIHKIQFPPVDLPSFDFHINLLDVKSNTLIQDNVPELWKKWNETQTGTDPLGANFRPGFAKVLISQDEYWEPNGYFREGTFHKQFGSHWVSFSIETETRVSARKDEVIIRITLGNRSTEPLELNLLPAWTGDGGKLALISGIQPRIPGEYPVSLAPGSSGSYWFAIRVKNPGQEESASFDAGLEEQLKLAATDTRNRLEAIFGNLPSFHSENRQLVDFYNRCILSVAESRWERNNFIVNPFWAVGTWLYTISWDNSYNADLLSQLDPASMKSTLRTAFSEGKMTCTYISWRGGSPGIIYIQEPFALRTMIDAYLRHTGDESIFGTEAGGKTILGWMKAWADKLHNEYVNPRSGLIDMGKGTEELIEIRTDGYNYVVPVVNGLYIDFLKWLSGWCQQLKDPDFKKYQVRASAIEPVFHQKLWNPGNRWFDNLYPDGSRGPIYTNHLFDLLDTGTLTDEERIGLLTHLNDNEFLGPYNMFSISRQDRVHWDLIDSDWGGGGAYTGAPLRLVRSLYAMGQSATAWTILSRFSRYAGFFPVMGQNMRATEPSQDESSMPLEVSAGAGMEAIVYGLFGIRLHTGGSMEIRPYYQYDTGKSGLTNFRYRGKTYDIEVTEKGFRVTRNGTLIGSGRIGTGLVISADGQVTATNDLVTSPPQIVKGDFYFPETREVAFSCPTPGAAIYYTTKNEPLPGGGQLYTMPVTISASTHFRAIAISDGRKPSPVSDIWFEKITFRDTLNADNVINKYPYPHITANLKPGDDHPLQFGLNTLIDGRRGGSSYRDGQWAGLEGEDLELTLSWEANLPVHSVSTRFMSFLPDWVFLPESVVLEISKDGVNYEKAGSQSFETGPGSPQQEIREVVFSFAKTRIRSLKIRAKNIGECPSWHKGAGGKAWIFLDEIVVR